MIFSSKKPLKKVPKKHLKNRGKKWAKFTCLKIDQKIG